MARWTTECANRPKRDEDTVDRHDPLFAAVRIDGERDRTGRHADVAEEQNLSPIVPICDVPARKREQKAWQKEREAGETERERLPRVLVHLVADRDAEHLGRDDQRHARDEVQRVAPIGDEIAEPDVGRDVGAGGGRRGQVLTFSPERRPSIGARR